MAEPKLQNRFYGLGNSSVNLQDILGVDFYQSAVNTEHLSVGLLRDFWQNSSFQIKAGIERNETDPIANTFLTLNDATILGSKDEWVTIPLKVALGIDFRDKKGLPYNGARAVFSYENNSVLSDVASDNFGVATGFIEYFLSTKRNHPITLGLRVGGATSHGDIPWFKLPTLGTDNGLRGYLQDRFVGESMTYFNSEVRESRMPSRTVGTDVDAGRSGLWQSFKQAFGIWHTAGRSWGC
ncbi:BamA/TamA family outer membrane protein [candidate division KSB1 bacterium]|nr:BamA/TamA family outer membrane protein [candidate division KSB1 bacterium]